MTPSSLKEPANLIYNGSSYGSCSEMVRKIASVFQWGLELTSSRTRRSGTEPSATASPNPSEYVHLGERYSW